MKNELAGQPEAAAGIEQVLGRTYLQIGDFLAAEEHARSAYATHRRLHRGRHEDLAGDLSLLAETSWQRCQLAIADSLGREAVAEKHLLLAEQGLREPRESNVRRRLDVLETLVELQRTWESRAPSAARTAALRRWTAARDAEAPELRNAIAEGRVARGGGGR